MPHRSEKNNLARSIFVYILILVNMPDPIRKRFHYGLLWPLRPACSRNRAGSYMPDPTSRIHFSSVFPKKAWSVQLCKTDPDPIWTAWSGFGQRHLVWKLAGVQESSDPVSGRTQPACYQFPIFSSHFQTRLRSFTDVPDNIIPNQPRSDLVLAECARFWPNGSGPEAIEVTVQESPGPPLGSVSQPIRPGRELDLACLLGYIPKETLVFAAGNDGRSERNSWHDS